MKKSSNANQSSKAPDGEGKPPEATTQSQKTQDGAPTVPRPAESQEGILPEGAVVVEVVKQAVSESVDGEQRTFVQGESFVTTAERAAALGELVVKRES